MGPFQLRATSAPLRPSSLPRRSGGCRRSRCCSALGGRRHGLMCRARLEQQCDLWCCDSSGPPTRPHSRPPCTWNFFRLWLPRLLSSLAIRCARRDGLKEREPLLENWIPGFCQIEMGARMAWRNQEGEKEGEKEGGSNSSLFVEQ